MEQSTILNKNIESFPSTSKSGGINIPEVQNQERTDECQQQSYEFDYNQYDDDSILELNELFPNCATGNQVIVSDKADFDLPQIFEEQTRFSDAVSESLAEFVNSACTKKADVANLIEANQIPSNCKSLVPPLINSEKWSYLYSNIQQRDKSLQEVQKMLGLSVVPMIKMAEMLKTGQIVLTNAKTWITQAIALACHSFFEINIKRRYFIRPYVSKKFQPLCSASCPIEEYLFPKDLSKRMKEITDASEINKQFRSAPKNFRGRPYGRIQNYKENWYKHQGQRGRGYQRHPRGHMRGRCHH